MMNVPTNDLRLVLDNATTHRVHARYQDQAFVVPVYVRVRVYQDADGRLLAWGYVQGDEEEGAPRLRDQVGEVVRFGRAVPGIADRTCTIRDLEDLMRVAAPLRDELVAVVAPHGKATVYDMNDPDNTMVLRMPDVVEQEQEQPQGVGA